MASLFYLCFMIRNTFVLFLSGLIILSAWSCDNHQKRTAEDDIQCYVTTETLPLMLALAQEFLSTHQDVKFKLHNESDDLLQAIDSAKFDMFTILDDTLSFSGKGLRFRPIGAQVVLTVFSNDNPGIQILAQRGADPSALAKAFNEDLKSWNEIHKSLPELPINTYRMPLGTSAVLKYESYLGVKSDSANRLPSSEAMYLSIINDPLALGYLNSSVAFDPKTGFRRSGLYILPLDQDSSGSISDMEFIYDELRMLERAINEGRYPDALVSRYYLAYRNDADAESINTFLKWLDSNSVRICHKAGFFAP